MHDGRLNDEEILAATAHRPYPLPAGPWIMSQTWHDLLFAHWPLDPENLRAAMPRELHPHLDTFQGSAWVGVIPFWMSGICLRGLPAVPTASTFAELNVRTYLTVGGKPGVYFFSLDAASRLAVWGARMGFGLNYFHAKMTARVLDGDRVEYESRRTEGSRPVEFEANYAPHSASAAPARPGSIEQFFVERYCLYTARNGSIHRANIHHLPWSLQAARAKFVRNSMAEANGIRLPAEKPLLHFAKRMDVLVWPLERA